MNQKLLNALLVVSSVGLMVFSSGCATMHVSENGVWEKPVPENISVKEAARVERPWYAKGAAPFLLTVMSGSRTGLEWNEGRNVRPAELVRGIPLLGLVMVPYYCYEALTEKTMQGVANQTGIDKYRIQKYEAIIKRLQQEGRHDEAQYLAANSPFNPDNHPPHPDFAIPQDKLDGFKGNVQILWVELLIGHRNSLERIESKHLRTLELFHPLLVTRIYEGFEAAFGRKMEDIVEKENLYRPWGETVSPQPSQNPVRTPKPSGVINGDHKSTDQPPSSSSNSLVLLDGIPYQGTH